jgi:hypothetical protein
MGTFFFIDYVISFFVLLAIHAPWWAWVIHAVSAVVWFVIWALSDGGSNGKTTDTSKQEQS